MEVAPIDDIDANVTAQEVQPKKKGSKGMPKGVIEVLSRKKDEPPSYQARLNVVPEGMPPGTKKKPRGLGTFKTKEEAAAKVAAAEAQLAAGICPWTEEARKNKHKRGEVHSRSSEPCSLGTCTLLSVDGPVCAPTCLQAPPHERQTARRWGVYTTDKSHTKGFPERCRQEDRLTSESMPSRVEDIRNDPMRAWFEMDGELSPEPLGA